jgi:DNA-binding beta-propeller fold protein YncE
VIIGFRGFTTPVHGVFDTQGDLWVSDSGSNAVFEYTTAQLAVGRPNVIPNITITSNPAFTGPIGIAFDAAGDLWIANTGTTTIFEFNAASLPTAAGSTVTLTPNVTLSDDGNDSIQAPWALVFDSAGNL